MIDETEADIPGRVIDPSNPTLMPAAAEGILALGYSEADHARMAELAAESNQGTLTPSERRELDGYVFVGDVLSMLKAKARLSLRRQSTAASGRPMTTATRRPARRRAMGRCEYRHLPQDGHDERFSIDHVVAQQHLTDDRPENRALCCLRCNLRKGPYLSGLDPADLWIVPQFDPRHRAWDDHFEWAGPRLAGRTPTGRAAIATSQVNAAERVALRSQLIAEVVLRVR